MSWTRVLGSATLLAFVLSLTVGAAESAIPNPTNKKYYACFSKKTGDVRLINYPKVKTCPARHKRISWNAKGIPGAAGPAGPAGPAGAADWNATPNKPPGFADGVDDIGPSYASEVLATYSSPCGPCYVYFAVGPVPRNVDYLFSLVPDTVGSDWKVHPSRVQPLAQGTKLYQMEAQNLAATPSGFKIRAVAFADGIEPAKLKRQLKTAQVKVTQVKKAKKKRR